MRGCNRWSENGIKISQNISKSNKTKKLTFSQKTQVYIPAHPHYSPSLCTVLDTTQTQWPSYHQSLPIHTSVIYNCFKMKPLNPITLRVYCQSVLYFPREHLRPLAGQVSAMNMFSFYSYQPPFTFPPNLSTGYIKFIIYIGISNHWQYIWIIWSYSVWKKLAWIFYK